MRKPKAGSRKPPVKSGPPTSFPRKPPTGPVKPPTGPDYVGPYSRYGTAGPVNENVSKVRDILKYDDNGLPIPYRKKGGATKAAYKKGGVVKKVTAKKVMVKSKKK